MYTDIYSLDIFNYTDLVILILGYSFLPEPLRIGLNSKTNTSR